MLLLLSKIYRGKPWRCLLRSTESQYSFNNIQQFRQFSSQTDSINNLLLQVAEAEKEQNVMNLITLYSQLGFSYNANGNLLESTTYHEKSTEIAEKILGSSYPKLKEQFIHLGHSFRELKLPERSIKWYEKALEIEKRMYGDRSSEVAYTLTDLASVYQMNNDIEKAEKALFSASHYMKNKVNSNDKGAAAYFLYLGNNCSSKNNSEIAIDSYKKSRKIFENISGAFSQEIATIDEYIGMEYWKIQFLYEAKRWIRSAIDIRDNLNVYDVKLLSNFALLCKEMGNEKESEEAVEKGGKIIADTKGKYSGDMALYFADMGKKFKLTDDLELSRKLYARSLEVLKNNSNQNSLETATCYDNLAAEAYESCDIEKLIDYSQKSLMIKTNLRLAQYDNIINYFYLGMAYYDLKNLQKGEEYLLQAKELLESQNINKHFLKDCLAGLSFLYRDQERYTESADLLKRAIALKCEISGRIDPETASLYVNLGDIYKFDDKIQESINVLKEAVEINNQMYGDNNLANSDCYSSIGDSYTQQGEFEKAIVEHKKAINIRKKILGDQDQEIGVFYYALADNYKELKDWNKAAELYEMGLKSYIQIYGHKNRFVGYGYISFGDLHYGKGDIDSAIDYFQKAEQVFVEIPGMEAKLAHIRTKIEKLNKEKIK